MFKWLKRVFLGPPRFVMPTPRCKDCMLEEHAFFITCTKCWASAPKAEGTAPRCRVVAASQTRRLVPLRTMAQRRPPTPPPAKARLFTSGVFDPASANDSQHGALYDAGEQYRIVDTDFDILGGYESAPPRPLSSWEKDSSYTAPLPQPPFDALPSTVMDRVRDSDGSVQFTTRLEPALPPPVDSTPSPAPPPTTWDAPESSSPSPAPSPSYDPPPAPPAPAPSSSPSPAPSPSYESPSPPPSYDSSPSPSSSWD